MAALETQLQKILLEAKQMEDAAMASLGEQIECGDVVLCLPEAATPAECVQLTAEASAAAEALRQARFETGLDPEGRARLPTLAAAARATAAGTPCAAPLSPEAVNAVVVAASDKPHGAAVAHAIKQCAQWSALNDESDLYVDIVQADALYAFAESAADAARESEHVSAAASAMYADATYADVKLGRAQLALRTAVRLARRLHPLGSHRRRATRGHAPRSESRRRRPDWRPAALSRRATRASPRR